MIATEPVERVFTIQGPASRPIYRDGRWWLLIISMLVVIVGPALAHDSTSQVEKELDSREKYLELTKHFAPAFALQDVEANPVRLEDFRGQSVILNFLYSRCQEQCPLHSLKLAEVQQQLSQSLPGDRVQFITIATDTEDAESTAESMRAHGPRYGLDPVNWTFLYGGAGQEYLGLQLAAGYGLRFVPTGDGQQMHGVITFLIDTEGRLRARYHGLKFNSVNLTLHAAALLHDNHNKFDEKLTVDSPTVSKALSVGLFAALVLFVVGVCALLIYSWKRRAGVARRLPPQALPASEQDQ